jgi:hypothetical protein
MQLTPFRLVTFALALPLVLVVGTGACGQVTGLSNDYVFDLHEDGGAAAGDAKGDTATTDGSKSDAPTDAPSDTAVDAPTCSAGQAGSIELRLTQLGGTTQCKGCLANDCCTDVDSCLNVQECKRALSCRLDCTTRTGTDRHDCFVTCNSNSGGNSTPPSYTNGVGACSMAACSTTCAFQ